jgi:glycosyltransferase involved in cell wall biosynthesis
MSAARITVFGSIPFDRPWLTEHNLAAALAGHAEVSWVDPPRSPLSWLRKGSERSPRRGLPLEVHQTYMLPPVRSTTAQRLSRPLLRAQLRRALPRDALAVFARGPAALVDMAQPARSVFLVKDWTPAGAELLGRDGGAIEAELLAMCRRVDVVCAVTDALRATLAERGVESRLLRHGFAAEQADAFASPAVPPDLRDLPRPLIGYVGRVDDRLDWVAIARIAERLPDASVVLVGPRSPRLPAESVAGTERLPNVHLLGGRRRDELPGYLTALDCCLLPYRPGVWGAHGSPLKLWEYLYAGPPIVGSGYEVLREYADFVDYARPEELPEAVERAVTAGAPGDVDRRRAFALENTWEHRAAELLRIAALAQAVAAAGG